jgi:hypothetical protein
MSYKRFTESIDRTDFLLIDEDMFGFRKEKMEALVANSFSFEELKGVQVTMEGDDPGLLNKVKEDFIEIGRIDSTCFHDVLIWKNRKTDEGTQIPTDPGAETVETSCNSLSSEADKSGRHQAPGPLKKLVELYRSLR